ncbi:MAG: hypothetical protein AAGA56_07650 [Myxococcota bacterium]
MTLWLLLVALPLATGCAPEPEPESQTQDIINVQHTVADLAPFTTDGCSMFPDGTRSAPTRWQHCCVEHDFAYYIAGTRAERRAADAALADCVEESASGALGNLMWAGVRLGGTPGLPTWWRWGYGWKYDPFDGYRDLPQELLDAAETEILAYLDDPTAPIPYEEREGDAVAEALSAIPQLGDHIDAVLDEVDRLDEEADD